MRFDWRTMMENWVVAIATLIACTCITHTNAACDFTRRDKDKAFPNLWAMEESGFELTAEYTMPLTTQTDFYKEYYIVKNRTGRLDIHSAGQSSTLIYNSFTKEAFYVKGDTCELRRANSTLKSIKDELVTEWDFDDGTENGYAHGPSAMFLHAYQTWKRNDKEKIIGYMGPSDKPVRGLPAVYWRRCISGLEIDYYFTTRDHDDAFGFPKLRTIPLRVVMNDISGGGMGQDYDIITFQPFISDRSLLEVPAGKACIRMEGVVIPKMPDFSINSLLVNGEVIYRMTSSDDEAYDYISTFNYAKDVDKDLLFYKYTPWGEVEDNEALPGGLNYTVYDIKKHYIYNVDMARDKCEIGKQKRYLASYVLPKGGGYIEFEDTSLFGALGEYEYMSQRYDRGLQVHSFEAKLDGFRLGNRSLESAIITRNYLTNKNQEVTDVETLDALASIEMQLFHDGGKKDYLTFNFFDFETRIYNKEEVFNVRPCFKNEEDSVYVMIAFSADQSTMETLKTEVPVIKRDILGVLGIHSEMQVLRVANIEVEFGDLIRVTILLLDKPPIRLDYMDEVEKDKTIVTKEAADISDFKHCATACLESEASCWGFSLCGATCYFGTAADTEITEKTGCKLFRRVDNSSYIPSKEQLVKEIKYKVSSHEVHLMFTDFMNEKTNEPLSIEAVYVEATYPSEVDDVLDRFGEETNSRLTVVQPGSRLEKTGQTLKNFGELSYGGCQRICLDYEPCETMSYCVSDKSCVLSTAYGEDVKDKVKNDSYCALLTRTYIDEYFPSRGEVISQTAKKVIPNITPDECSRACTREGSFNCISFDHCEDMDNSECRLHNVHYLDTIKKEDGVKKRTSCSHFSKKYSVGFKKESNKKSIGTGRNEASKVTVEECARLCNDEQKRVCFGFDFCEDKYAGNSECIILDDDPSKYGTAYSQLCTHYTKPDLLASPPLYSKSTAAWVGILCFVVAAVVGVLAAFGSAYYKARQSS